LLLERVAILGLIKEGALCIVFRFMACATTFQNGYDVIFRPYTGRENYEITNRLASNKKHPQETRRALLISSTPRH
jgi:hypothetical protein